MSASSKRRVVLGLLFLGIGCVLLIQYTDLLPFLLPGYLISWKTILIALGALLLATDKNKSTGLILMLIGGFFLLKDDVFGVGFWDVMKFAIPAVFILAGVLILFPRRIFPARSYNRLDGEESKDVLREVNIFSGGTKSINSERFRGGEITCIFGGSELNFRNAGLAEGVNAIDITCIFGGVTLYVPEDWTIKIEATTIFGGFSDARAESNASLATDPGKLLVIKGVVVFGGGEIKYV